MLVLTRKSGESIVIGDHIKIEVLQISGRRIRLGIEAPASTTVHRHEVYLAMHGFDQTTPIAAAELPTQDDFPIKNCIHAK